MANVHSQHWHPSAAYLYALHLERPALAWEYLRRNPDYRRDWLQRRRQPHTAQRWGLRWLEDPGCDAREALPDWLVRHPAQWLVFPDPDPMPHAPAFDLWRFPGRKLLRHDGHCLRLVLEWPGQRLCLSLAPALCDGMAYAYALRAGSMAAACCQVLAADLARLDGAQAHGLAVRPGRRPSSAALQHMHGLQALDGHLAGASAREVAQVLFGAAQATERWHADGDLRARTRRLLRHGASMMRGGYHRLLQIAPPGKGRSASARFVPEQGAGLS